MIQDLYPLSPMQKGLVFHQLFAPQSSVYVMVKCFALKGELDPPIWEQAWQHVVGRNPILRTGIEWELLDEPLQVVYEDVQLPMPYEDWRLLDPQVQEERLEELMQRLQKEPFDLQKPPLMRCHLVRLSDNAYRFIWAFHHVLLDGWSLHLIQGDVVATYEALCQHRAPDLPDRLPFGKYIQWLQEKESGESFWRGYLKGFTCPTPLALAKPVESSVTHIEELGSQWTRLSSECTRSLQDLSRASRSTISTIIQSAWALLLHHYSNESDVVFGVTVSGRSAPLPGIETVAGLLINTVPVRVQVASEHATVAEWIQGLQQRQLEMQPHESATLNEIHRWSEVLPGQPLFESVIIYQNYPTRTRDGEFANLQINTLQVVQGTHYPLSLIVSPDAELGLKLFYDRNRFEDAVINRMLDHMTTLLRTMAADPSAQLSDLPRLSAAEEQQVLVEWNATRADYPTDLRLHQLVEAQAARTPDAIAVTYEGQSLTYRELNGRANQLARHLRASGVGVDAMVGVFMERSLEMVVALVGILKAGGAYLPLDPAYPRDRLAFMITDARLSVILTQERLLPALPQHAAETLALDACWPSLAAQPDHDLPTHAGPESLAYVIYTSGSTGKPKGAMIPHCGIVNRLLWMQETYQLTPADHVLQKTPFSFDVSVWEFFWPLITGARLVVARPGGHQDSRYLADLIAREGITTLHFVPSMLQVFLGEPDLPRSCRSLRQVMCSGEALPYDLQQRFFQQIPNTSLHNLYGPTEASVDVTFWPCDPGTPLRTVPIGRPVANTQIYILDRQLRPVPPGVPGELHIGGIQLARGYLNRPDLTAEKFIPDPFSDQPGARLYKTGDLARHLRDGSVEYLGRLDFQVKIRGLRIELGEIEAAIAEHPAVREVVVTAREDAPGDKQLVAYLVANSGQTVPVSDLRSFLKEKLPAYMLPAHFCMLAVMPLSPNGKVDRRALPAPDMNQVNRERSFTAPRNELEAALATVWAQVLRVDQVGIHDNFFELGGHSLLAMQVNHRVRHDLHVDVPLPLLFAGPTIAEWAGAVLECALKNDPDLAVLLSE